MRYTESEDWSNAKGDANAATRYSLRLIAKWAIGIVVIVAALAIGWAKLVAPALLDSDADNRRQSHQYVETQQSFLLQKLTACQSLEADITALPDGALKDGKAAQLKASVAEMKQRAQLIDPNEIPPAVTAYLETK